MRKTISVIWSSVKQKKVMVKCQKCRDGRVIVSYNENSFGKWFYGKCQCGREFWLKDYEFDYLQPSSPFFEMVYGNLFLEAEKNKKFLEQKKEERKLELQKKYRYKFSKLWERKFVEDVVLNEKQGNLINA